MVSNFLAHMPMTAGQFQIMLDRISKLIFQPFELIDRNGSKPVFQPVELIWRKNGRLHGRRLRLSTGYAHHGHLATARSASILAIAARAHGRARLKRASSMRFAIARLRRMIEATRAGLQPRGSKAKRSNIDRGILI